MPPANVIDVEVIDDAGPKTKYIHLRYHFEDCETEQNIDGVSNRGGVTVAYRLVDDEVEWTFSLCNLTDNFCRKMGRQICDGRLKSGVFYRKLYPGTVTEFMDFVVKPAVFEKAQKKLADGLIVEEYLW